LTMLFAVAHMLILLIKAMAPKPSPGIFSLCCPNLKSYEKEIQ